MQLSLMQSMFRVWNVVATPTRRRRSAPSLRNRKASMEVESLEQRMALTAAPFIGLTAASDTGVSKTDGYTKVANPVFKGVAPPRSIVSVSVDGQLLPITAKASASGAWTLRTQAALPEGVHTITGTAVLGVQPPIALRPLSMVVDRTSPTASLAWKSGDGSKLTFSEPVSGVRAAKLRLSGQGEAGSLANVAITSERAKAIVGPITVTTSDNNTKFTFQEQRALAFSGTYTLSFVKTGVTDRAGNPLLDVAPYGFRIE